jgi:hypothetical protein
MPVRCGQRRNTTMNKMESARTVDKCRFRFAVAAKATNAYVNSSAKELDDRPET